MMDLVDKDFLWKSVTCHPNDRPWVTDMSHHLDRGEHRVYKLNDQDQYKSYRNKGSRMGEKLKH